MKLNLSPRNWEFGKPKVNVMKSKSEFLNIVVSLNDTEMETCLHISMIFSFDSWNCKIFVSRNLMMKGTATFVLEVLLISAYWFHLDKILRAIISSSAPGTKKRKKNITFCLRYDSIHVLFLPTFLGASDLFSKPE